MISKLFNNGWRDIKVESESESESENESEIEIKYIENKYNELENKCNELENKNIKYKELEDKYNELEKINKKLKQKIDSKDKHFKVISKETGKFKLIKIDINTLKNNFGVVNWSKNRPACKTRIDDIVKYYRKNNVKIIPGIIYVWYNSGKYHITDGLHRYDAAIKLNRNIDLILHINYSNDENIIIEEFLNINKSISIPSIYLDSDNLVKKELCQKIVNYLCEKYPKFISPSRNHYTYNFNRDLLIEFFSELNIDFHKNELYDKLINLISNLNYKAKFNIINGNITHPKKCDKYNFYLFYLDKSYIKSEIENHIN